MCCADHKQYVAASSCWLLRTASVTIHPAEVVLLVLVPLMMSPRIMPGG